MTVQFRECVTRRQPPTYAGNPTFLEVGPRARAELVAQEQGLDHEVAALMEEGGQSADGGREGGQASGQGRRLGRIEFALPHDDFAIGRRPVARTNWGIAFGHLARHAQRIRGLDRDRGHFPAGRGEEPSQPG
jgi:hypothetical protein